MLGHNPNMLGRISRYPVTILCGLYLQRLCAASSVVLQWYIRQRWYHTGRDLFKISAQAADLKATSHLQLVYRPPSPDQKVNTGEIRQVWKFAKWRDGRQMADLQCASHVDKCCHFGPFAPACIARSWNWAKMAGCQRTLHAGNGPKWSLR